MESQAGKYEVRWLEGGRHPSRLFDRKGDADAFDLEKKRQRQLGALAPTVMRSRITLAEFMAEEWWPRYAIPNLAPATRHRYLEVWGHDLLPGGGRLSEMRELTPLLVEDLRDQLREIGGLSPGITTQGLTAAFGHPAPRGGPRSHPRRTPCRRSASPSSHLPGSFVSLLLWEGRSLTYVAEQAGHSVATLARHYAGVLRELEHAPRTPAAEAIRAARERIGVATGLRRDGGGGS